jgi:hypothetical protein
VRTIDDLAEGAVNSTPEGTDPALAETTADLTSKRMATSCKKNHESTITAGETAKLYLKDAYPVIGLPPKSSRIQTQNLHQPFGGP